jgi:acetyl/propionyl-CoA carboxylase alpha subunit
MSARRLRGRFRVGKATHALDLRLEGDRIEGTVDGEPVSASLRVEVDGRVVVLDRDGRRAFAALARTASRTWVSIGGVVFDVARTGAHDAGGAAPAPAADPFAASQMTGVLTKVHVAAGAAVEKGAPLFAVEAMKMEYVVSADRAVTIAEVKRAKGDRVSIGEVVVTYRA